MLRLRRKSSAKWRRSDRLPKSRPELQIRIMQLDREGSPPPGLRLPQAKLSRKSNQVARGRIRQIAVGTLITERPPHRTVRAQFGHTAAASSPIRLTGKLSPLKNATSTSGWLATLISLTILPLASTMHTLDHSKDTSIPACCSIAV